MLSKLEALYLNILRVVILVLASVLLVVAVIGAAIAAPMLLSSFGGGETNASRMVRDDKLRDYLGQGAGSDAPDAGEAAQIEEAARQSDRRIRDAAANITRYVEVKQGFRPVTAAVTGYIQERADSLPSSLFDRYADSILTLSKDLAAAPNTNAPVNVDRLIDWHFAQFTRAADEAQQRDALRAAEDAARRGTAMAAGAAAVSFFMMFLLLVFVFVLVKIERNLRRLPVLVEQPQEKEPRPLTP